MNEGKHWASLSGGQLRMSTTRYLVLAPLKVSYLAIAVHVAFKVQPVSSLVGRARAHEKAAQAPGCVDTGWKTRDRYSLRSCRWVQRSEV